MAQSTNLKPCPFCGNEEYPPEQASRFESNMFLTKVECGNCGATMESWNDTAILDTAPNWNTRPIEDALQARIDRAKDLLQEELGEWLSVSAVYLPDHFLQLRQVLDVLEGSGE